MEAKGQRDADPLIGHFIGQSGWSSCCCPRVNTLRDQQRSTDTRWSPKTTFAEEIKNCKELQKYEEEYVTKRNEAQNERVIENSCNRTVKKVWLVGHRALMGRRIGWKQVGEGLPRMVQCCWSGSELT